MGTATLDFDAGGEAVDALVDVTEPLLQPGHRLAVGGEAEMAGLDDAGMHWADRNLVQALAFDRQERIGRGRRYTWPEAERMARAPMAMIEPGPHIGKAFRLETEKIANAIDTAPNVSAAVTSEFPTTSST